MRGTLFRRQQNGRPYARPGHRKASICEVCSTFFPLPTFAAKTFTGRQCLRRPKMLRDNDQLRQTDEPKKSTRYGDNPKFSEKKGAPLPALWYTNQGRSRARARSASGRNRPLRRTLERQAKTVSFGQGPRDPFAF